MKKYTAILLALLLLGNICVGCGKVENSSVEPSITEEQASEIPVEAAVPETEAEDGSAVLEAADSFAEAALTEEAPSITYPLAEAGTVTLSVYGGMPSGYLQLISKFEECASVPVMEEATGISLEFITASEEAGQTQFDLLIASGDYPDMFDISMYAKGARQAYEDGIILALGDYVDEFAPDYMQQVALLDRNNRNTLVDEEGNMLFMANITEQYVGLSGLGIRQDWLNELGLERPETISELTATLEAFHNTYSTCDRAFHLENDGIMACVVGAFGVPGFDLTGSSGLGLFLEGDTVQSSLQADGYYDYLQYLIGLYNEGLVHKEFYSFQRSYDLMMSISCFGASGIWSINTDSMATARAGAIEENPDYEVAGNPYIVMDHGDTYELGSIPLVTTTEMMGMSFVNGTAISTTCQEPELAVSFINYFFTDAGYMLTNWGIEGLTFEYDANNKPYYTDMVMNNEKGITANNIKEVNCYSPVARLIDKTTFFDTYPDNILEAIDTWSAVGYSKTLPTLTLNTQETDVYSPLVGDIVTQAGERILRFITGAEALTEENWSQFQEELNSMGIEDCVSAYQSAYDRYISRD